MADAVLHHIGGGRFGILSPSSWIQLTWLSQSHVPQCFWVGLFYKKLEVIRRRGFLWEAPSVQGEGFEVITLPANNQQACVSAFFVPLLYSASKQSSYWLNSGFYILAFLQQQVCPLEEGRQSGAAGTGAMNHNRAHPRTLGGKAVILFPPAFISRGLQRSVNAHETHTAKDPRSMWPPPPAWLSAPRAAKETCSYPFIAAFPFATSSRSLAVSRSVSLPRPLILSVLPVCRAEWGPFCWNSFWWN